MSKWCEEDKIILLREIKENKLLSEICKNHKREEGSIQNYIKKLIKEKELTKEEYEKYLKDEEEERLKYYDNKIENEYGFTIVIPIFKKLYEKGGIKYENLIKEEQKAYILELVEKNKNGKGYELYFEEHKNKNIHSHGTIFKITDRDVEKMRIYICKSIGITKIEQMKVIFHYMKLNNYSVWKKYCLKDQEETIEELEKKIVSEEKWEQILCCVKCKRKRYNPVLKEVNNYGICKLCYNDVMLNNYVNIN